MKRFSILILNILLCYSFSSAQQAKLIEKVEKKEGQLIIPYEKYKLDNGLTLLVHEDHSDPIVHVEIMYHVGSAREQEGRSGFAHFFEHMMFQGSDHVGDDVQFKIVTEAGGTMNGNTTTDRTVYFETMPSNNLETGLWLEADRMGFLLDAVTQNKFEVQRATVKNERGQNYDNKPYGVAYEKISEALYPVGHPYSCLTIGYIDDLNRVDVNDLKKFFLRWYGPNNATLVIAGDVNPQEVVKLTEKYFGSINKGPEVISQKIEPAKLQSDRYISYEDNIRFPMLQFVFPTVANRHPDEAPLDILADILGGGNNSIFYQKFVKTQKAVNASVYSPCQELAGTFNATVLLFPDKSMVETEKEIRAAIAEFEQRGVTDDDLRKYKASYESQLINSLNTVKGKAEQIGNFDIYTGNPNYLQKEYERYMNVTKEDIMRVYNTYIKNKPAVILSVYPKGKPDMVAKPDNFKAPQRNINAPEKEEYKNLVYNKPKDNFDRNKQPIPGPIPIIHIPDLWKENFPNGLKIIGTRNDEIPSVTMQLTIEAGHRSEDKAKAGIADMLAALLDESSQKHTSEQLSAELEKLGSVITFNSGPSDITIIISSLTKNIDATLKLLEEKLFFPLFDEKEFDRVKKTQLEGIANQATSAVKIADNVFNKLLYGNEHKMAVPISGTQETVASITLDDVKKYYQNSLSPAISQLVVVGDITKESFLPKLDFLKNWKSVSVKKSPQEATPKIEKTKLYLVNKDKAAQSEIRMGCMALPYNALGDYYKCIIMNYPLGAPFNCRINMDIREEKGYTYGAHSYFNGSKYDGLFYAYAGVRSNVTDSSVIEFMKLIKQYADSGITANELEFTKKSMAQSDALRFESPSQKATFLKRLVDYNLDKNYLNAQNDILKKITKPEIDALAKKYIPYKNMDIVVVGDKAKIYDGLVKLGYEIVELDTDGNPVKK